MKLRQRQRIYPHPRQVQYLAKLFGCARVVWNDALAYSMEVFRATGESVSNGDLQKIFITQAKHSDERSWLAEVATVPLQQSIRDLGVAFKNFFNSVKGKRQGPRVGKPRFKKRSSAQSVRFTKPGIRWSGRKLVLPGVGALRVKWSRDLPSAPSSVTLIKDGAGRYFASFVVEVDPAPIPDNGKGVGVDLGIATFATLSTGEKVNAPTPLKSNLKKLARWQKKLSRCQKGSNRRDRVRRQVARIHAHIGDIRSDFLHKLSSRLVFENQDVNLEDLNVSGMVKNRKLSRAISDLGWRQFRSLLEAKALMYGRTVNVIDRWTPTTQTCSTCGFRGGKKALDVREWVCTSCGAVHDRDVNAAININVAGGQSETQTGRLRGCKTGPKPANPVEASTHLEHLQLRLFGC